MAPGRADDLERMILNHVVEGVTSDSASGSWQQVALSGAPLHYRIDRGEEFVNGARITRRLDVPPHRICIVDRLLAAVDAAPGPAAGVPRDATQTETKDRGFGAGHARAAARSRKRFPFVLLFRRNFANGMRNVRVTARAATAKIRTYRSYFAATLSCRGAAQFISDEDIAQYYASFLQHFGVELDDEDLQRQKRAAAAALYQAGLYRHKLLFLYELMKGFSAAAGPADPHPVFFNYCSSLIGGEEDLARAALYYRLALQLVPDFAEALYALGLLKRRAGATTEAIALFEAAAVAPPHPNAVPHAHIAANSWRNLAEIRLEFGKNELAEACFHKALDHLGIHGVYHAQIAEFMRARSSRRGGTAVRIAYAVQSRVCLPVQRAQLSTRGQAAVGSGWQALRSAEADRYPEKRRWRAVGLLVALIPADTARRAVRRRLACQDEAASATDSRNVRRWSGRPGPMRPPRLTNAPAQAIHA